MSKFYGQIQGQATTIASRRGSANSHIKASVQSYDGSIITELYYGDDDELRIRVEHAEGSSFSGHPIYDGTVDGMVLALHSAWYSDTSEFVADLEEENDA